MQQSTQFKHKITIQLECFEKNRLTQGKKIITRLAQDLGLATGTFICLKKKAKQRFTVISGPHVHKKSRQQYRIDSYCGFFSVLINDKQDYIKFQSLKKKLYESCIDQGFDVTFRHSKKEKLRLFGSND
jgi:ribosomal protein S10